jgi:uncharacterized protein
MRTHFILYVADQQRSTAFYSEVLGMPPKLDVPGMTEFRLGDSTVLGLMPEDGAARLFGDRIKHPSLAQAVPRCEVYLVMPDADEFHTRALAAGAHELSPMAARDWGHRAAYSLDADGHILAFAEEIT